MRQLNESFGTLSIYQFLTHDNVHFPDVGSEHRNSKKKVRLKNSLVWDSPTYGDFVKKGECEI